MLRAVSLCLVTLSACLCLTGCSHRYGATRQLQMQGLLQVGATVYLPEPAPVANYPRSGTQTAEAIRDAFDRSGARFELGAAEPDPAAALAAARARGVQYLVLASVDVWEDNATEWSGKRDRIAVRIHLVDTGPGEPIDSTDLTGTSRKMTLGGDHPQELLRKPIDDYVTSLFLGREVTR